MRDFFINAFEKLVGVVIVLMSLVVIVLAIGAATGQAGTGAPAGILGALIVLLMGAVYVVFVGGFMYLGLGIYQNTKRMADAMERRDH